MKKTFCIKGHNSPQKLPLVSTIVLFIALDYWHASDLVRGIFYTIFAIYWIFAIIAICLQESVDIFEFKNDEPRTEAKAKSKFQERIEQLAKERGIKMN